MSDVQELRESFLNAFPAAALLLWQDRIVAVNGAVRRRLPQLEPGEPIPQSCWPSPGRAAVWSPWAARPGGSS